MIKVYHSKNFRDTSFFGRNQNIITTKTIFEMFDGDGYEHVAHVETTDLEEAYMLTNHIAHSWLENHKVKPTVSEARSSSVGDIFETEDGVYIVASVGFELLRKSNK